MPQLSDPYPYYEDVQAYIEAARQTVLEGNTLCAKALAAVTGTTGDIRQRAQFALITARNARDQAKIALAIARGVDTCLSS